MPRKSMTWCHVVAWSLQSIYSYLAKNGLSSRGTLWEPHVALLGILYDPVPSTMLEPGHGSNQSVVACGNMGLS